MKKNKCWIKIKRYPHIGEPIDPKALRKIKAYIQNQKNIAKHAFYPLIHRKITSYPFKWDQKKGKRKRKPKPRDICYATHLDALIYSYYNKQLSDAYEQKLDSLNLTNEVVAYRRIPIHKSSKTNKSHIHFAKEAFDFIRKTVESIGFASVIVSDISGFFDNLDHKLLKDRWKEVLNTQNLSDDVYNIYRNVTHFSYIDEQKLLEELNHEVLTESKPGIRIKKKVKSKRYFRSNDVIAYCERKDIAKIRHLITCRPFDCIQGKYVRKAVGIPQGLPISATLANVYMLNFDKAMKDFIDKEGGFYRRYSDDIILILPGTDFYNVEKMLDFLIRKEKLTIQSQKNKIRLFRKEPDGIKCCDKNTHPNKLEYLGFSYDGKQILIKSKSISHYYLKQKKYVTRGLSYAKNIRNNTNGILFERNLLRRFTRIGARMHSKSIKEKKKRMLEGQRKKDPTGAGKQRLKYGNYHSYVLRAAKIMEAPEIKGQLSRNLHRLRSLITDAKIKLKKERTS